MKGIRSRNSMLGAVMGLVALVAVAASLLAGGGDAQATATNDSNSVAVCCAWNGALADGDLTYKISGGDDAARAIVRAAVEEWEVVGITLTEITGNTKPNLNLKFKRGGGQIQGQALRKFDSQGFVKAVDINVSGRAFGEPNNAVIVGLIAKHEVGHGLGTGHANFDGDLLSPSVSTGSPDISACDLETVVAANHWMLTDGLATPHQPHVSHVHCGAVSDPTPPPAELQTALVQSIDCAASGSRLLYTITIVADDGSPIEAATVSGSRLDPRGRTFIFAADTNSSGQVTIRAGRPARGDHLITVDDVVKDGIEFDPALGESSKTCTI